MLSNTLVTNEIKDAAGAEIEFQRHHGNDRSAVFAKIGESPSAEHRLMVGHQETGTGIKKRRRSVNRFDLTVMSDVDATLPVQCSGYIVLDTPVGALTTTAAPATVLANLGSFVFSTGADSTIKFDGSGNGAQTLLNGTL